MQPEQQTEPTNPIQPAPTTSPAPTVVAPTVITPTTTPLTAPEGSAPAPQAPVAAPDQSYAVPTLSAAPVGTEEPSKSSGIGDWLPYVFVFLGGIGPGFVLVGLYFLIRSWIKHDKSQVKSAILMIIFGAAVTGAIFYFLKPGAGTVVKVGDVSVNLTLPADTETIKLDADYASFGAPLKGSSDKYAGQVELYKEDGISVDDAEKLVQTSGYKTVVGESVEAICKGYQLSDTEKLSIPGAQVAYRNAFTCPKQSDGVEYGGYFVTILTPSQTTIVTISAERSAFQAWDSIIPSLTVEDK